MTASTVDYHKVNRAGRKRQTSPSFSKTQKQAIFNSYIENSHAAAAKEQRPGQKSAVSMHSAIELREVLGNYTGIKPPPSPLQDSHNPAQSPVSTMIGSSGEALLLHHRGGGWGGGGGGGGVGGDEQTMQPSPVSVKPKEERLYAASDLGALAWMRSVVRRFARKELPHKWHKKEGGSNSRSGYESDSGFSSKDSLLDTGSIPLHLQENSFQRDQRLVVIGVDIEDWSHTHQYLFITGVLFAALIVYGYLQEYLVMVVFHRQHSLFLTFLMFVGYALFARLQRALQNIRGRKVPLGNYFILGFMIATNQALTNLSMNYLNYPAKVLFKSSRVVPTMLIGVFYRGRRYAIRDYMVVIMLVLGLVTFVLADVKSSPDFSPTGVVLISIAIVVDAISVNVQESLLCTFGAGHDEVVYYAYMWGSAIMFVLTAWTGDLLWGLSHLMRSEEGHRMLFGILSFTAVGFIGISCMTALTKHFGALVSSITSAARKGVTLALSFILFPKPANSQHVLGGLLFLLGLVVKASFRKPDVVTPNRSPANSPDGTPATARSAIAASRKRLLSGGAQDSQV